MISGVWARLLAESNRSILDISLTTGFSAMGRVYESCHKLVGVTAHQYRLNTRSAAEQLYTAEKVTA